MKREGVSFWPGEEHSLLLLGGLRMEVQWSVDLLPPKVCWSLLEVEAEIVAIFHRETPVIAAKPGAK